MQNFHFFHQSDIICLIVIGKYAFLVGATADWWSVGIILYEVLVGIPPFNAENPQVGVSGIRDFFTI